MAEHENDIEIVVDDEDPFHSETPARNNKSRMADTLKPPRFSAETAPGMVKRLRYRVEWLGMRTAFAVIPLLPRARAVSLAGWLGNAWHAMDPALRAVARANVRAAMPELPAPNAVVRASFRTVAQTALDVPWSARLNTSNFDRYFDVSEFAPARDAARAGGGVVFVTIHYGSFEWLNIGMGLLGMRGVSAAQDFKNPHIGPMYNRLRTASGTGIATRSSGLLPLFRSLRNGNGAGILVDLTLKPSQPSVIVDFFGLKTCMTFLPALLHLRSKAPVVPILAEPLPGGRCKLAAHPPLGFASGNSESEITREILRHFEGVIRKRPELWLWGYKHWRYRESDNPDPYPFYANVSSPFEKKLRRESAGSGSSASPTSTS